MKILHFLKLLILFFGLCFSSQAQTKEEKKAQKEAKKKEREQIEQMLKSYTACTFDTNDKFIISETARVTKNKEQTLGRATKEGTKGISRTDSYRLMISFTDTPKDVLGRPYYFANVRPDRSKPSDYEQDKIILNDYLENLIVSGSSTITMKQPFEKEYNGFMVKSVYRSVLAGNNLGVSIVFDDINKVTTTIYFLSEPKDALALSHFNTINEWMLLRNNFLNSYTKCVADNLKNSAVR